jgi:outer membrane receptor protein involved in Fe transport
MTPRKHSSRKEAYLLLPLLSLLAGTSAFAQQAAPAPAASAGEQEDTIVLTPFQVDASKDTGYYAENTLAGSRLNTKVSDLGSSISVITKQQIDDTASVDINDVFRYEINTEGSLTYTPSVQSLRSDGVVDVNSGVSVGGGAASTNASANRVRGIGTPSMAINYYPSVSQVPMDSYNISALEISRGPNSMLFGMGSPAGIVNQTTAQANTAKQSATVSLRVDSNGSYRGSLSFNQPIIKGKLAIYGAVLDDQRRFERKPSYDNSLREYGAITLKPFSKTTVRATVEYYHNDNRRPNSLTPRDFVTQWNLAGKPIYDSLTRTVTQTATGKTTGVYVINALSPYANDVRNFIMSMPNYDATKWNAAKTTYNGISIFGEAAMTNTSSVLFTPGIAWTNQPRATQQIYQGSLQSWYQPLYGQRYRTAWGTATNPTASADLFPTEAAIWANPTSSSVYNRDYSASAGMPVPTTVGSFKYPGVTDRSIYDWKNININQMNYGEDKQMTYNVELEQRITDDLYLNAGYFRQNYRSLASYTVAQLNVATLFVDTTKYLPNGQPNPFVGKTYVEDSDPDQGLSTQDHNHYRLMLAYTPDFTKNTGWTKWLGHHQILGLWSKQDSMTSFTRRRLEYVDSTTTDGKIRYMANQNNNTDGTATGWNRQTTSIRRAFYLAGPNDASGTVTTSSGEWNNNLQSGDITVYDYATGGFKTVNMTMLYNDFDASTGRNQRSVKSISAGMTNYFWKDRLITTFGARKDDYKARATSNGQILNEDGTVKAAAMTNPQKWVNGVYQTETVFNRWNRWDRLSGNTSTMGGVFKPFRNWHDIDSRANSGSLAWEFVRDFGISFNKSDNFNPPEAAQVDGFGKPLPKPTGEGKDYGFQFTILQDKLFARIAWFEATNENERTNPGSSISRLTGNIDTTLFRNWCRTIALINMGMDPRTDSFGTNLSATEETAVQAAAEKIWKQPYTYYDNVGTIWATRNAEAKGVELQITYNPLPNWTMRFTGGKQVTKYKSVLREFDAWFAQRNPIWTAAKASDYLLPQYANLTKYTRNSGREVDLTTFWASYGYDSNIRLDEPNGYYNAKLYYDGVVTPQSSLARDLEGQAAPGQRRFRGSYLTNYNFTSGKLKGFGIGGSERWEDKAVIGYLGRSSGASTVKGYMDLSDTAKPVYDKANFYTDVWVSYQRPILKNKVRLKIQLNVDNVMENGGLRVTAVNYDGSPYSYRIIDSRLYKLTTSLDF